MQTVNKNKRGRNASSSNQPENKPEDKKTDEQLTLVDHNNQPVNEPFSPTSHIMKIDFNSGEMPDLDELSVVPLDLSSNYWTPATPNEKKRAYFVGIKVMEMQSLQDKDVLVDLPCAFFYGKEKGIIKGFCNASKILVSILEQSHIEQGTALEITWLGKKNNSSNSFKSDNWSVKPLMLKIAK